jgi:hypothetical protein
MKPRNGNNRGFLRQVLRVRQLAQRYGLPVCDDGQLELFTAGELRAYFYNLSDGIKSLVLEQNPEIARRWKFYDDMPVCEFIERIDRLRAHRQERNSLAREIGLEPITSPVESPQSKGMAEARNMSLDAREAEICADRDQVAPSRACRFPRH